MLLMSELFANFPLKKKTFLYSDDVYFKSKCTAVLNGQIYYDQLKLKTALNPSTNRTSVG